MDLLKKPANAQKLTLVCFHCRAVFKKAAYPYWEECIPSSTALYKCTFCHSQLAFLGRYFHAPAKKDERQWRKIELLWKKGWTADGYSSSPRTLSEAKNYEVESSRRRKNLRLERLRAQNEEKWRSIRIKRQHLQRHAE